MLDGRRHEIHAERDRKLQAARRQRRLIVAERVQACNIYFFRGKKVDLFNRNHQIAGRFYLRLVSFFLEWCLGFSATLAREGE